MEDKTTMKPWLRVLIGAVCVLGILLLGSWAYRRNSHDRSPGRGGMADPETPDALPAGWKADLEGVWYAEDAAYTVTLDGETLCLAQGETALCRKAYYLLTDGGFRVYAEDSEPFGPFSYFDYVPGTLTGCTESGGEPQYIAFLHQNPEP